MSLLSICIPTYNRKERLISQLESLAAQPDIKMVPIIISDNASNYSVSDEILPLFSGRLDLHLYRFGANTSVVVNISSCYLYAKTEWVWLLGDDDETIYGALNKIVNDIMSASPQVVMIKYSLDNEGFLPNKDEIAESFSEYISHYKKASHFYSGKLHLLAGDCAFASTCVLRRGRLLDVAYSAFFYGYNQLAFMAPVLFSLGRGCKIQFSSYKIVRYRTPEDGKHWSLVAFLLGLCSWRDMPLAASEDDKKWFVRFMSNMVSIKLTMGEIVRHYGNRPDYARYIFEKIIRECYQLSYFQSLRHQMKLIRKMRRKEGR